MCCTHDAFAAAIVNCTTPHDWSTTPSPHCRSLQPSTSPLVNNLLVITTIESRLDGVLNLLDLSSTLLLLLQQLDHGRRLLAVRLQKHFTQILEGLLSWRENRDMSAGINHQSDKRLSFVCGLTSSRRLTVDLRCRDVGMYSIDCAV